jgi:hypothetical protein
MIAAMRRAMLLSFLLALLASAWPTDAHAQFYRWVDERGNAHYAEGLDNVPERFRRSATPLGLRNSPAPAPGTGAAAVSGGETEIRFVPGRHIVVHARINDSATARLILDTGAASTLISPRALAAAGVSLTRGTRAATTRGVAKGVEVEVRQVPIDSLAVGSARVGRMLVASYDMDMPDVEGLLGQDFLGQFNVSIDPAAGVVKLTRK